MSDYMSFPKLTDENYRVVDLTKTLSTEMSVWPGDVEPHFHEVSNLADDGVNLTEIGVSLHTGTHIDAPRHFVEGGETIDKLPLHSLLGRAVIYRVPGEPEGQKLRLDEVASSGVEVNRGDIFIAATGLGTLENDPDYYRKFPVPAKKLLEWLLERGVKCYGTDAPSLDPLGSKSHEKHKLLLGDGVPVIENLTNLEEIEGTERVDFFALPLKLDSLEASPCRAVAFLDGG